MCAILHENDVMSPESSEGRERITRLEERMDATRQRLDERIEANKRQIDTLMPLSLQVGVMTERLDSLRTDLHDREREFEDRLDKHERRTGEALERHRVEIGKSLESVARSFENQITHCSNEIGKVAEVIAEERRQREKRAEQNEQSKTQRVVAKYGLATGLTVAIVAGLFSIITNLLG